ncbi:MAG: class A beta-lactamase [Polyangiaceae bacterium]
MANPISRRALLVGVTGAVASGCIAARPGAGVAREDPEASLAAIEARVGGRLGVYAIDTESGRAIERRSHERFAMCSTFKLLLAGSVLARADRGELSLEERVPFGERDLLSYAPVTRARIGEGALTVGELVRAAVVVSDNTAANLLLARTGGPTGLTRFVQSLGDDVTRLDRWEPTLNENAATDPRDTTAPRSMVTTTRALIQGDLLRPTSRESLVTWLRACETGRDRLRAGLAPEWTVGDKTGTGARGAFADVAIAWRPRGAPIFVAAYASESTSEATELTRAFADVGRVVARAFAI